MRNQMKRSTGPHGHQLLGVFQMTPTDIPELVKRLRDYHPTLTDGVVIHSRETVEQAAEILWAMAADLAMTTAHKDVEITRLRGHMKTLIHLCQDAGVADDFVAQMFPDAKRKNGQPASEFTKRARRAINEAKAALGETHDN